MLNLTEAGREWLTENILGWTRSYICGYDLAKEGKDTSVQYAVWITEQGTHQYLPDFEDALMTNKLLEALKKHNTTVRLETFVNNETKELVWKCLISSEIGYGYAINKNSSHAIVQAILRLGSND